MKKLLILSLVLGIASLASAGIELSLDGATPAPEEITINVSDTVKIDLHAGAENVDAYIDIYFQSAGNYALSNATMGPVIADFQSSYDLVDGNIYGLDMWEYAVASSWAPATDKVAGEIFSFDLHCLGEGDVIIELLDASLAVVDTITIHQIVPEPATMGLLALGGLFLRRRK